MSAGNDSEIIGGLAQRLEERFQSAGWAIAAIDGCGGAGKSTFAELLQQQWPGSEVVHTDDFAFWDCQFDWWPRLLKEVLEPAAQGRPIRFRKNDWTTGLPGKEAVIPGRRLILEGVSSSRREFRPFLSLSIWIETSRDLRLARGLERDGVDALEQWRTWMAEEDEYVARQDPMGHADVALDGSGGWRLLENRSLG